MGPPLKLPDCHPEDHPVRKTLRADPTAVERASRIFRALGDGPRLRLLELLADGESCVTAIVKALGEKFSTVSQRLRLLRSEGLVRRRRDGTHLYYALADRHVVDMIHNALEHAAELEHRSAAAKTDPVSQTPEKE